MDDFKLKGDKLDSSKTFQKVSVHLTRKFNVDKFMEAANITDPEPFSEHPSTASKQEANINLFYSSLVNIAGSIQVEKMVEKIETNIYNDAHELTTTTRKARQLLRYYASLVRANNVKDSSLSAKRDLILFRNTDSTKLKDDLERMFDEFDEAEREMTEGAKMRDLQKKEHFLGILGNSCKAIQNTLDTIDVMDHATTFEIVKEKLLQAAQNISTRSRNENKASARQQRSPSHDTSVTTMSANATQITMDKAQYDEIMRAISSDKSNRNRSESPSRQYAERGRPRSRSNTPDRNFRRREGSSQSSNLRARSPSKSNVTFSPNTRSSSPYPQYRK